MRIMVRVKRYAELSKVIAAFQIASTFSRRLNSRQQNGRQNRDRRHYDEQFENRNAARRGPLLRRVVLGGLVSPESEHGFYTRTKCGIDGTPNVDRQSGF
jgi:hypothetical protein